MDDVYAESKEMLSHGPFNLRKFVSNSPQLQDRINEREAALTTTDPTKHPPTIIEPSKESFSEVTLSTDSINRPGEHKVLRVCSNVKNDHLVFGLGNLAEKAENFSPQRGMS